MEQRRKNQNRVHSTETEPDWVAPMEWFTLGMLCMALIIVIFA